MNRCSVGFFCQRDQATLNVSSMRLRDVLVLADDDRTADPELLGLVVIMSRQPFEDIVPFAKVNLVSCRVLWIRAEKAIDSGPFGLLARSANIARGATMILPVQ